MGCRKGGGGEPSLSFAAVAAALQDTLRTLWRSCRSSDARSGVGAFAQESQALRPLL